MTGRGEEGMVTLEKYSRASLWDGLRGLSKRLEVSRALGTHKGSVDVKRVKGGGMGLKEGRKKGRKENGKRQDMIITDAGVVPRFKMVRRHGRVRGGTLPSPLDVGKSARPECIPNSTGLLTLRELLSGSVFFFSFFFHFFFRRRNGAREKSRLRPGDKGSIEGVWFPCSILCSVCSVLWAVRV
jgi:hypothetical protein